jgi:F-type H+-transporting ATPase subunit a
MHPISVSAEKIFTLFGFLPVTNSLLTTWVVMVILIFIAIVVNRKKQLVPKGIYNIAEAIIEGFLGLFESVLDNAKLTRKVFTLIATIFIFVLFSNWFGLLPGVGSIGFFEKKEAIAENVAENAGVEKTVDKSEAKETKQIKEVKKEESAETKSMQKTEEDLKVEEAAAEPETEFVPLFRAGSSDLSFTLAIALYAVIFVQIMGVSYFKLAYFKKFFDFRGPIQFFVGILELISDLAKMISFSFRLFGNVFAGEVLLVVITFLVPYIAPIPFYGLEVFVGMVQALVFSMLTLVFVKLATTAHH